MRLYMIAPVSTAARLKKLAAHYGVTQIEALERALAAAEHKALRKMTPAEERANYDSVTA